MTLPCLALLIPGALVVLSATAMPAMAATYPFENTQSRQQILVACPSDPATKSRQWWRQNCRPVDAGQTGEWTGSSTTDHPDFLWVPVPIGR